jgi:hypothetical protein
MRRSGAASAVRDPRIWESINVVYIRAAPKSRLAILGELLAAA